MSHAEYYVNEFPCRTPQSGTSLLQSGKQPMEAVGKKEFLELMFFFSLFLGQSRT